MMRHVLVPFRRGGIAGVSLQLDICVRCSRHGLDDLLPPVSHPIVKEQRYFLDGHAGSFGKGTVDDDGYCKVDSDVDSVAGFSQLCLTSSRNATTHYFHCRAARAMGLTNWLNAFPRLLKQMKTARPLDRRGNGMISTE